MQDIRKVVECNHYIFLNIVLIKYILYYIYLLWLFTLINYATLIIFRERYGMF